jgi:hypothetical protein
LADRIYCHGVVAIKRGAHRFGVRLLGAADHLTDRCPRLGLDDRRADEQALAAARAALGETEFAAAWAKGQVMTLEQAVVYALQKGGD